MTISLIHGDPTTQFSASATSVSITIDNDVATGDLIVIPYFTRSAVTVPSGFTKRAEVDLINATSQPTGFLTKTSDGTEGGTSVVVAQASSGRIEALHSIWRSTTGSLEASQSEPFDGGTTTPGAIPAITEGEAFLAICVASNAFANIARLAFNIDTGSDVEWSIINGTVPSSADGSRLSAFGAIYSGADTTALSLAVNDPTRDWNASILTFVEGGSVAIAVGTATETDQANIISSGEIIVSVGTATEADAGNIVTPPVVKGARVTLYSGATLQASIAGITAMWWDSSPPTGNPVFTTSTASTDSSGVLTVDLDSTTALPIGDPGHLSTYKLDGTEEKDSLAWQGRLLVEDIS